MNVLFYTLSILIALYIISKIIPQAHYYLATILGIVIASYFIITNYISKKQNKIFDKSILKIKILKPNSIINSIHNR